MSKRNTHSGKINIYVILFILSLVFVVATLFIPKTINDYNALNNISCGLPIPFVIFNSIRALPDYAWTSECINWSGNFMESAGIKFLWLPFFMDVALVFVLLSGSFCVIQQVHQKQIKP